MSGISPQQKKDPQKRERERSKDWKEKRGETSVEKLHVLRKKKRGWNL
jgi:hypothetical protein